MTAGGDDSGSLALPPAIRDLLRTMARTNPSGASWLEGVLFRISGRPAELPQLFAAARRHVGQDPLCRSDVASVTAVWAWAPEEGGPRDSGGDGGHQARWSCDDAARVALLLVALPALPAAAVPDVLADLYGRGEAGERRAVLRAVDEVTAGVPGTRDVCARLLSDAVRTNDPRLLAAAMGTDSALRLLDRATWDQSLVKCLFLGVPLSGVARLDAADSTTAAMVAFFVAERTVAGRPVPSDVRLVLDRFPGVGSTSRHPGERSRRSVPADVPPATADAALPDIPSHVDT